MSLNNIYVRASQPAELLDKGSERRRVGRDRFFDREPCKPPRRCELANRQARDDLRLCDVVGGRAGPGRDALDRARAPATHWEQLYFPLLSPLEVKPGETVAIDLRSRTSPDAGTHVAWTATQRNAKGRELSRQALNLDKGFLALAAVSSADET